LVFSRAAFERETGNPSDYGTMASFVVEDGVPGALCSALKAFAKHNVNLTSIRSRPSRQELWKYIFFVEFDGTIYDDNIKQMCAELHHYCRQFSVLGSFKKCAEEALES
jgi:prephenate dehydratase